MPFAEMTELEIEQMAFQQTPLGPASRGCCKVINGNACGSGSLVGKRGGKSLVLTNAHVAGSRVGRTVRCTFPFLNNRTVNARVIMAAYSDRIMMDWAVLECEEVFDLSHSKLKNEVPDGRHYTGGYPRCRGPYFQEVRTTRITHNGTVWRWQPNSIGGQSGSGVHSFTNNLQYGLLTWSWGGDGAGQTTRSIWFQYANRAAVGFVRPPDLIELNENRAEDLEEGFFAQTNITTLPIWDHLDDDDGDDPEPPSGGGCPKLAAELTKEAAKLQKQAAELAELARRYGSGGEGDAGGGDDDEGGDGPLFGMG